MDRHPYTDDEWAQVRTAALGLLNATLAEDAVLHDSHFLELRAILNDLRAKHGEHPVLLETEADFCSDPQEQTRLYSRALTLAESTGHLTYSIRIALARVLLDDTGNVKQAQADLSACGTEIESCADASEKQEWNELMDQCRMIADDRNES